MFVDVISGLVNLHGDNNNSIPVTTFWPVPINGNQKATGHLGPFFKNRNSV